MDYSKASKKICENLYKSNKSALNRLCGGNPSLLHQADIDFNNFLFHLSKKMSKIYCFVRKEEPKKPIIIKAATTSFEFKYKVIADNSSSMEITLLTSSKRTYKDKFLLDKIEIPTGFVYFLSSEFGYKIGCTKDIDKRLNTFGVQLPFKVELHSYIATKNYTGLERELHVMMGKRRIKGEWFNLSDEDFIELDKFIANKNLKRITNGV